MLNTPELNEVINLTWQHGEQMNDHLRANEEVMRLIQESPQSRWERPALHRATGNKQIYDPLFPTYNANRISGSNYIAAEGPNDIGLDGQPICGCMARFLENTVFNETYPVQLILAIGQSGNATIRGDFTHYFAAGSHVFPVAERPLSYRVESNLINNRLNAYALRVEHPNGNRKNIQVLWLPVRDLQPIPNHTQALAILAYIYRRACYEPVLIHCAAGVGRTGVVVFIFKILDHYEAIFAKNDAKNIAGQLRDLLTTIRQTRPAFITTKKQLESAVQCAIDIYHLKD